MANRLAPAGSPDSARTSPGRRAEGHRLA